MEDKPEEEAVKTLPLTPTVNPLEDKEELEDGVTLFKQVNPVAFNVDLVPRAGLELLPSKLTKDSFSVPVNFPVTLLIVTPVLRFKPPERDSAPNNPDNDIPSVPYSLIELVAGLTKDILSDVISLVSPEVRNLNFSVFRVACCTIVVSFKKTDVGETVVCLVKLVRPTEADAPDAVLPADNTDERVGVAGGAGKSLHTTFVPLYLMT